MDLLKTLLVYMMVMVTSSAQLAPDVTPIPPEAVATPTAIVTQAPTAFWTSTPTAAPIRTPTPRPYTSLYVGDRGENVRKMQRRLVELGYMATNAVDGIYGQATKKAVERFQYYNNLQTDGIAGKNTLTVLYDSPNVVSNPSQTVTATPAPTATSAPTAVPVSYVYVPVYYMSTTGVVLFQTTIRCVTGSNVLYAVDSYVPTGYTLQSERRVSVSVNKGTAVPATVTYYYAAPVVTAAPTSTPSAASVTVYYRDTHGKLLNTAYETYQNGSSWIYPKSAYVPAGYSLTGDVRKLVTVTAGVSSPASVTFTYAAPEATATPTPVPQNVTVPVYYRDTRGNQLNYTTITCAGNRTTNVYPQSAYVPAGYVLIGNAYQQVTVSAYGVASPSAVTFTYMAPVVTATPTYAPSSVNVAVYYVSTDGVTLNQTMETCAVGATDVYANQAMVPDKYTLVSNAYVTVRVSSSGVAAPSSVVFTYMDTTPVETAKPTGRPTQVPIVDDLTATVRSNTYLNLREERSTSAKVLAQMPNGAVVTVLNRGPEWCLTQYNDIIGYASTDYLVFDVDKIKVQVNVFYQTLEGDLLYQTSVMCEEGSNTIVCDTELVPMDFMLQDAEVADVIVYSDGTAIPNEVVFHFMAPPVVEPTSEPVVDPWLEPTAAPALSEVFGGRVLVNGQTLSMNLYQNAEGEAMLPFGALARALGCEVTDTMAGFGFDMFGYHFGVTIQGASLDGNGVEITLDGEQFYLEDGDALTQNGEVYIRPSVLVRSMNAALAGDQTEVDITVSPK